MAPHLGSPVLPLLPFLAPLPGHPAVGPFAVSQSGRAIGFSAPLSAFPAPRLCRFHCSPLNPPLAFQILAASLDPGIGIRCPDRARLRRTETNETAPAGPQPVVRITPCPLGLSSRPSSPCTRPPHPTHPLARFGLGGDGTERPVLGRDWSPTLSPAGMVATGGSQGASLAA